MKQDVIVIGAGIIGLATAESLLIHGAKVTILDRNLAGQESSWAGGGILSPLCPWHYSDAVTQLTSYSAKKFPEWAAALYSSTGIDPELRISGMRILPPHETNVALDWCNRRSINIQQCIPTQEITNTNVSAVPMQEGHTLLLPDIAQIRNPRLLQALHIRVLQLGGKIVEKCKVENFQHAHKRIQSIDTACGQWTAEYFIICAGAWSSEILGTSALNLRIRPIKGQMLLFKFDNPPVSNILVQEDLYIIPRQDGHVLIGSTLEDTGFDKKITHLARENLFKRALSIVPALRDKPVIRHWAGLRPGSPNNLPTIASHPDIRNLFVNSGHFRYGVTMAPASAEIMLNYLTNSPQPMDITPYQTGWHENP